MSKLQRWTPSSVRPNVFNADSCGEWVKYKDVKAENERVVKEILKVLGYETSPAPFGVMGFMERNRSEE